MYKLLLCLRYLRTRWIALASIVSVMLGVATMIVVNSVMAGFTSQMQDRIRGILSDLILESRSMEGMPDADAHMERIQQAVGDSIEGMTPAVVVPAVLSFQYGSSWITRQVQLIGIDEQTQGNVSDFCRYLQHPENRRQMSFVLREDGYDEEDHQAEKETPPRTQMKEAGWPRRRMVAGQQAFERQMFRKRDPQAGAPPTGDPQAGAPAGAKSARGPEDPFAQYNRQSDQACQFDPAKEQYPGAVLGIAMASYRTPQGEDRFLALPGDDVKLTFPTAGMPPKGVSDSFTVVDFYESKMSEFDASYVFVPIRRLQELRGMIDPATGIGSVNSIEIKLKPGADAVAVRDKLREVFSPELYCVSTWRDKQGALLMAVQTETAILNVLLFLIIAVAGFGILAIFYMIVVEKTRDIGILKSLGASGRGVLGIFLAYGLSLGLVGSGAGMALGLLLVHYINPIADGLGWLTGHPLFNPEVYYFFRIPTIVIPQTVAWIVAGALAIAVLASVLPARRAAGLHPVEALRYE
jgi:lipoprotein-releasing system permease protein